MNMVGFVSAIDELNAILINNTATKLSYQILYYKSYQISTFLAMMKGKVDVSKHISIFLQMLKIT